MIVLFYALVVLIVVFDIVLFTSMIVGAPFVPSRQRTVIAMIESLPKGSYHKAVDLGAGDARIVIALARIGIEAHGYEINPFLVFYGNLKIAKAGLRGTAFMHWQNLWRADLSQFDLIVVYGIFYILPRLAKKIDREIHQPTVVISEAFQLPGLPYTKKETGFYVYELPLHRSD